MLNKRGSCARFTLACPRAYWRVLSICRLWDWRVGLSLFGPALLGWLASFVCNTQLAGWGGGNMLSKRSRADCFNRQGSACLAGIRSAPAAMW